MSAIKSKKFFSPWLLILPSFVLALFIVGYPFCNIVFQSVHEVSRFGKVRGFNGADNFIAIFSDPVFIDTLYRTAIWTVCVVGGTIMVAVPTALILARDFYGRGLARAISMLPWSISLTMTAIIWRWAFNTEFGMVNLGLLQLGIIHEPMQWLANPDLAFPVEILVGILVSVPFTVTIFLGGLTSIPLDIYEAARIEGATAWQQFRRITIPLLRPFINIALVLNVIYVFNSFPIIWVMTQGGPDNSTHILVTYLYELAFRLGRPGEAAAVSLVMLAMLFAFTAVYMRMQGDAGNEEN